MHPFQLVLEAVVMLSSKEGSHGHTLVHPVSRIGLGPGGETTSLKVFFKRLFAPDLLSSDVLFLFVNHHAHWPHSCLSSRCSGRKDCRGDPWRYSKCEGSSELPFGSVQPHLFNICPGRATGIQIYQEQILALLRVHSIRRETDVQMQ